ncbi:MAG TPA: XdhC family protein [Deltaproteobacteria bacterium]|nr:XdhC family protein [Deltaproteobacteria bacterium]HPR55629.1 XdhC family protein [Deltaproteobacteria bacterium]HXK47403.1 XdhC family protein [Deltaproteobacteria bacterium]
MAGILARVSAFLSTGQDLVLARVVSSTGSAPREAGARMIILADGRTEGTIGGGLVEATALREAARIIDEKRSALTRIAMTADDTAEAGMICGGTLEFLCEHVKADRDAVRVFDALRDDEELCRRNVLCTEFLSQGRHMLTLGRFLLNGGLHDEPPFPETLLDLIREAAGSVTGSAMMDIGGRRFCLDVLESRESLFIFGAGHVARETAALASHVGFRVSVLDDRSEFASPERFPFAETRVVDSFSGCLEGLAVEAGSYVVIVTRGHIHDKTVLEQAMRTRAGYIGMIGSRRKRDTIYKALLAEGFTEEELSRVHCPIGLPIETDSPEEIAVSIVGELINERALRRKGAP